MIAELYNSSAKGGKDGARRAQKNSATVKMAD
jgi:hypothetical protein